MIIVVRGKHREELIGHILDNYEFRSVNSVGVTFDRRRESYMARPLLVVENNLDVVNHIIDWKAASKNHMDVLVLAQDASDPTESRLDIDTDAGPMAAAVETVTNALGLAKPYWS